MFKLRRYETKRSLVAIETMKTVVFDGLTNNCLDNVIDTFLGIVSKWNPKTEDIEIVYTATELNQIMNFVWHLFNANPEYYFDSKSTYFKNQFKAVQDFFYTDRNEIIMERVVEKQPNLFKLAKNSSWNRFWRSI